MTKFEIIEEIARDRMIEDIIGNLKASASEKKQDLQDLKQMIYLELLEKDSETIEKMYDKGCLKYFVTRMIINNIQSKTSKYYYMFKKNKNLFVDIDNL